MRPSDHDLVNIAQAVYFAVESGDAAGAVKRLRELITPPIVSEGASQANTTPEAVAALVAQLNGCEGYLLETLHGTLYEDTVSQAAATLEALAKERDTARKEPLRGDLEKSVCGAIKSAISAHGPVTVDNASSAAKRVIGHIKLFGRQERDDLRARLERALDLVRYQRAELHQADLIDDDEYVKLCSDDKSVDRLHAYDDLRQQLAAAQAREARLREAATAVYSRMEQAVTNEDDEKACDFAFETLGAALAQSHEQDGGAKFVREARYVVLKWSDIKRAVHPDDWLLHHLNRLCERVSESRKHAGKRPLECVVVESDWPEYEPTWAAIEARMKRQPTAPDAQKGQP